MGEGVVQRLVPEESECELIAAPLFFDHFQLAGLARRDRQLEAEDVPGALGGSLRNDQLTLGTDRVLNDEVALVFRSILDEVGAGLPDLVVHMESIFDRLDGNE